MNERPGKLECIVLLIVAVVVMVGIGAVLPIAPRSERMVQFGHTNAASTGTNGVVTFPERQQPLYVIPEAVLVQTPLGPILFAHQQHVAELCRLFPHHTLTNLVIWSKP